MDTDGSYRERIYKYYTSGRLGPLAPATPDGLSSRAPYMRRMVKKHFPPDRDSRMLELGCGHGTLIYFAREAGYRNIRGVDVAWEQVKAAETLEIVGVEQGDLLESLEQEKDASLNTVIAFDVLEHLTREEILPVVDEVFRVLTPCGRWLIHVPNGASPFGNAVRYADLTHEIAFTRESLGQLFMASEFSALECYEDAPVVHGGKSAIRWALWQFIKASLRMYDAVETGELSKRRIYSRNLLAVATK